MIGLPGAAGWRSEQSRDPFIGRHTADGWWVRARAKQPRPQSQQQSSGSASVSASVSDSERVYLLSRGQREGYTVSYQWKSAAELEAMSLL